MAIPSGAGTEVLKRVTLHANNNASTEILSGSADHIYTILSIIFNNQTGSASTIAIRVDDGSNDINLLSDGGGGSPSIGAEGTFVFNDKFVLYEDDILKVYNTCTNGDWYVSYIDQHF